MKIEDQLLQTTATTTKFYVNNVLLVVSVTLYTFLKLTDIQVSDFVIRIIIGDSFCLLDRYAQF